MEMVPRQSHVPPVPSTSNRVFAILGAIVLVGACSTSSTSPLGTQASISASANESSTASAASPEASPTSAPSGARSHGRIVFTEYLPESLQFELFAVDPDGSNLIELMPDYPRGFGLPRWSWAGDLIAATSMGRDGFETIVPSVPTRTIHLQPPDPTLTLSCAGWSPDRVHLICEGWSPTKAGREGLYTVLSSNGGEPTQLTKPPDGIHDVPG